MKGQAHKDSALVRLDLNAPTFQAQFFALEKNDIQAIVSTLRKIAQMTWEQVYRDKGLRWELLHSYHAPTRGEKRYSLRVGKSFRAIAFGDEAWLRVLTLHPDHDSAYE